MIILNEVAIKIQAILNGEDDETNEIENPLNSAHKFVVQTTGFHLDSIADNDTKKNFIPVFVDTMGGQFNPVKGIAQGSYSIPIEIYFPVRFKDDFFLLGDFLVKAFVGNELNYGEISGRAVSNISVPVFGEITDQDLKQFSNWVGVNYKRPLEIMEPYLSMRVTLYLTNAADGLLFGNDVQVNFSFTDPNTRTTYTLNDIDVDGLSLQSNAQATPEQEEGADESTAVPFGTTYGQSFKIYPNLNKKATSHPAVNFYQELLKLWLGGHVSKIDCQLTIIFGGNMALSYTRNCFIQSIVMPIEKGELLAMTLTFAKKTQIQ